MLLFMLFFIYAFLAIQLFFRQRFKVDLLGVLLGGRLKLLLALGAEGAGVVLWLWLERNAVEGLHLSIVGALQLK